MGPQPPPRPQKNDEDTIAHQNLLSSLDIYSLPKPFRSTTWKVNQRRNKNLKTILGDVNRARDAANNSGAVNSIAGTNDNSGINTPVNESGVETPSATIDGNSDSNIQSRQSNTQTQTVNFAEAEKSLSKLVLSKTLMVPGTTNNQNNGNGTVSVTYTNIESAPSLAHSKHYCDITGLPAPYTDPKTRLRYHNKEVYAVVSSLGQQTAEGYLEARGAHVVLK